MRRPLPRRLAGLLAAGLALAGGPAGPAAAEGPLRPKPPEIGSAASPGETRRIIHPFGEWTLVCDENLKKKQKVCNVSQSFLDGEGALVFSWSLAGTSGGAPVLILRTRNDGSPDVRNVKLMLPGLPKPQEIWLSACEQTICVGYQEVGPEMGKSLRGGGSAELRITQGGRPIALASELKNLNAALAALK